MFERSSLRYAHTTGYTSLTYTENTGEFIITCGSDGDIRKWIGIDDDDPSSSCLGEFVICIAHHNGRLLASTDRNTVQAYTFPDIEGDGTLMRFTAPATCLRATKKYIVAGSEDATLKLQMLSDGDGEETINLELNGHEGPVLAVDVNEEAGLVASVAGDGKLKIWNIENGEEIKSFDGLPKVNSFESAVCFGTPCFELKNNLLAYVKDQEICVLNSVNWEQLYTLRDERASGNYTCCQFSPDGQLLAAGTTNGELSVFNVATKKALKCEESNGERHAITCVVWKPNNNIELSYCDANGQLGTLFANGNIDKAGSNVAAADGAMDFGDIEFLDDGEENDLINMQADEDKNLMNETDDEGDDDENADVVSLEKLKRKVMRGVDGVLGADDDTATASSSECGDRMPTQAIKVFKQQAPFQPGATPSKYEHFYLVWNNVGIVTGHADGVDGSIDVEFHDASVHHALHIRNYNGHDMASLSSSALVLGAQDNTKIDVIALTATGNRKWSIQLPDCESPEAIASSTKIIAVATSAGFLRLFTILGTQRDIIALPGPVVSMAAYEDRVVVAYHAAPANEKHQHLNAMLVQLNGLSVRCQQVSLPLPADRQLSWIGFTDCGSPAFSDSMGLVYLYGLKSNCWFPICDTLKQSQSVSNNYFVIGISERHQVVQAVLCRGTSYPMTNPRPIMQQLPMRLPNCDPETEKSNLEDMLMRANCMSMDNAEKVIKETVIKLFALACRTESEARAEELVETVGSAEILSLAVKYASKIGRAPLADSLSGLLPQLESQQDQKDVFDAIDQSPAITQFVVQNNAASDNSIASKLAPKSMELNSAKRASLKRFASTPTTTPTISSRKAATENLEPLSGYSNSNSESLLSGSEMQENIYSEKSAIDSELLKDHSISSLTRTPFNSVNPFASKRKLSEVDLGGGNAGSKTAGSGIIMGANKLKMIKK